MPFTDEMKQKIAEALTQKGVKSKCPVCQSEGLAIADLMGISLVQDIHGEPMSGGGGMPCAVVLCENCGYVLHFHLAALGLWNEIVGRRIIVPQK